MAFIAWLLLLVGAWTYYVGTWLEIKAKPNTKVSNFWAGLARVPGGIYFFLLMGVILLTGTGIFGSVFEGLIFFLLLVLGAVPTWIAVSVHNRAVTPRASVRR